MNAPRGWPLGRAVRVVRSGGVIAYPTEAVYGLGCDPLDPVAVLRLLLLKARVAEKGLILIGADLSQFDSLLLPLAPALRAKVLASWPGAVTWLLPSRPECPQWLTGGRETLAVRVPDHPLSLALCRALGHPLVSTSANPAGRAPARSALQVRRYFGDRLDYILAGPVGGRRRPSEIRDGRTGTVIRPG